MQSTNGRSVALGLVFSFASACAAEPVESPAIDSSWVEYKTKCSFSFFAPPGLVEHKEQGTDSCVVSYQGADCDYSGDYGLYSGSLMGFSGDPNYQALDIQLGDEMGTLVTSGPRTHPNLAPYVAAVHVQHTLNLALNFVAMCTTVDGQELAARIAQTVRFDD